MNIYDQLLTANASSAVSTLMLEAALQYASRGFRVLPLHNLENGGCTCPDPRPDGTPGGARCRSKGKHPRIGRWQKEATTDADLIKRWWRAWPAANIGLAMGGKERLVALDIDGPQGFESLAKLETEHHLLPVTLTTRSGRENGGQHRIFRIPDGLEMPKNEVKFADGLDTRSENGQIVAPPSMHESGRRYEWVHATSIEEMPVWLYERIRAGKATSKVISLASRREPRVTTPEPEEVTDLSTLREALKQYKRKLHGDAEQEARLWLIDQVLVGEPFAEPGNRDISLNIVMSILAGVFRDVPVEAVIELVRPSISKMDLTEGGVDLGVDHWLLEAADMYRRSSERMEQIREKERRQNDEFLQVLNEKRAKAQLAPVADPFVKEGDEKVDDNKLIIYVISGKIEQMVFDAVRSLALFDKNIYQRSGELVTIAREPQQVEDYVEDVRKGNDILLRPGTPRIYSMSQAMVLERLASTAKWLKPKKGKKDGEGVYIDMDPHTTTVRLVHERRQWLGIKPLRAISETPVFAPSGRPVMQPGYDAETKVVYLPSLQIDPIPDRPTQAEAAAALKHLWIECFCDFPYRGLGDSDPADTTREERFARALECPDAFVAIAAMLTIFARPAIKGAVVGSIFEAAAQGSGKSYQMHIVSIVTTGRAASVTALPMDREGRINDEALDKMLAAYARAGVPIVAVDNIKGTLGGPALELKQTAPETASFRLLGTMDYVELPWSAVFLFSGNNMSLSDDVAQRNMISRLESAKEDPRDRPIDSFRHPDILNWVRENRSDLVRDCLIILRAFFVAENKPNAGTWGSFEAWSKIVPPAILYAGGPNVIKAQAKDGASEDSAADAHTVLMQHWPFKEPAKAADVLKKIFDGESAGNTRVPVELVELRGAVRALTNTPEGKLPNPTLFGCMLRSLRGKIRNGYKLQAIPNRDRSMSWKVVRIAAS